MVNLKLTAHLIFTEKGSKAQDARLCDCYVLYLYGKKAFAIEPCNLLALSNLIEKYGIGAMQSIPMEEGTEPIYLYINLDTGKGLKVTQRLLDMYLKGMEGGYIIPPVNYKL